MSAGVDLSLRTLYDQIWAYAHFINEAPDRGLVNWNQSKYKGLP